MAVFEKNSMYVTLLKLRRIYTAGKRQCILPFTKCPACCFTKIQTKARL